MGGIIKSSEYTPNFSAIWQAIGTPTIAQIASVLTQMAYIKTTRPAFFDLGAHPIDLQAMRELRAYPQFVPQGSRAVSTGL